ncbi:MAG: histidinol dehydrogenase [Candidatus Thorarchaeota archaeon]|nr:histidinol dehydrogenase [Candidatus Thorarchaeota archaeon]
MSDIPIIEIKDSDELDKFITTTRRRTESQLSTVSEQKVKGIIKRVQRYGDRAIIEFTRWFDKLDIYASKLRISRDTIKEAYNSVEDDEVVALKEMASRLTQLAKRTLSGMSFSIDIDGTSVSSIVKPLESIGCYVPGGSASYSSSLMMCAIPARVAGVERIVVCTPPKNEGVHPLILVAADLCGVDEIYQVGGAQAIAALAYGTETIDPVQKIVGPGNIHVTLAKIMVARDILIDSPAGPSELLVIADDSASPKIIALDMISQAEHSVDAISILVSPSRRLCEAVSQEITKFVPISQRRDTITESLKQKGGIFVSDTLDSAIELVNKFAAEHVEILTENPRVIADRITSAGLILLGNFTPVAASDYCLGVNHVLPTQGYATSYSGLTALDFVRIVNVVESTKDSLARIVDFVSTLAQSEGLPNHAKAIQGRFKE